MICPHNRKACNRGCRGFECRARADCRVCEPTWPRADPAELARFDPRTKVCTMNCGRSSDDPRSEAERQLLCTDCLPVLPDDGKPREGWYSTHPTRGDRVVVVPIEEVDRARRAALAGAALHHTEAVDHAHELLRRLGYHRDGDHFINVNRQGAEALHVSTIATIVHAALIVASKP